jgi:hypothetical protein
MRTLPMVMIAGLVLGAAGCRRKQGTVRPTPVSQLSAGNEPWARPGRPVPEESPADPTNSPGQQPNTQSPTAATAKPDGGARTQATTPPNSPAGYQMDTTPTRLPMWKQRAKFY